MDMSQLDADLSNDPGSAEDVVALAVDRAPENQKRAVVRHAASRLSEKERQQLRADLWPQDSTDRRLVYMTGFIVAGVVAVALAAIAWGASTKGGGATATAILVLATGFSSAILGGLLGAYKSN